MAISRDLPPVLAASGVHARRRRGHGRAAGTRFQSGWHVGDTTRSG